MHFTEAISDSYRQASLSLKHTHTHMLKQSFRDRTKIAVVVVVHLSIYPFVRLFICLFFSFSWRKQSYFICMPLHSLSADSWVFQTFPTKKMKLFFHVLQRRLKTNQRKILIIIKWLPWLLTSKAMRSANSYAISAKNPELRVIPRFVINENNSVTLTLT